MEDGEFVRQKWGSRRRSLTPPRTPARAKRPSVGAQHTCKHHAYDAIGATPDHQGAYGRGALLHADKAISGPCWET